MGPFWSYLNDIGQYAPGVLNPRGVLLMWYNQPYVMTLDIDRPLGRIRSYISWLYQILNTPSLTWMDDQVIDGKIYESPEFEGGKQSCFERERVATVFC